MADIETISILKVGTDEAVRNIADLKANIKALKEELNGLTIGEDKYKEKLEELEVNQAALKNAMHGTATSMEQIAAAAKGQDESYNGLVRTMAKYKEELRAIDTSTEEGKTAFKNKAEQIKNVNDKLKDLDKLQGNYQRNVGNYKSAVEGLGQAFVAVGGDAGKLILPLQNLNRTFDVLRANPIIGVLGLLAVAFNAVATGIKSDEENTNAWNRALAAFQPIADGFMRTMQSIAEKVTKVAGSISELLIQWGLLDEEAARQRMNIASEDAYIRQLQRDINLSVASHEEIISELRAKAAERDKYTASERLKFLEEAKKWQMKIEDMQNTLLEKQLANEKEKASLARNDAETNDKINQLEVALIEARTRRNTTLRRLNREISSVKRETTKVIKKSNEEEEESDEKRVEQHVTAYQRLLGTMKTMEQYWADDARQFAAELEEAMAAPTAALQEELDAQLNAEFDAMMAERELNQQRINGFITLASAVGSVATALGDIYEADAEADKKAAQKSKALRTAGAVLSTLSGAVSAFMSTWSAEELPLSMKMVLAPTNAAAVLAAGYAQIKKMNAVKVGDGGGSVSTASVSAPTFAPNVAQVRTITGASEEERLNRMAADNRVYLVYSDIERANTATRVRVQETEF